ncbi:hypothetical protein BDR06DRAFT_980668 [Suillus hirtellus]|nr:hypothetical protein BDR06DRAFT_980668 [Suillus hirtellus]
MKCAGQGHHPDGIGATKLGACVIFPRFLYALFLAININSCLACCNISSDIVDSGLNHGYAFFVEEHAYKDFIGSHDHNVVNPADSRVSYGLVATGTSTIDCARHNFKWPCSVSDLQKGKRCTTFHILALITFLVPKFHLLAHVAKCQSNFSFNFIKGVGHIDGEALDSRRNTLDDHFND